jgi:hypothetical protein
VPVCGFTVVMPRLLKNKLWLLGTDPLSKSCVVTSVHPAGRGQEDVLTVAGVHPESKLLGEPIVRVAVPTLCRAYARITNNKIGNKISRYFLIVFLPCDF